MAKFRIKRAGTYISWLIRGVAVTLDVEVEDRAGFTKFGRKELIWSFWHDRMFVLPWVYERWCGHVRGSVLSSPSGDGQVIADVCAQFGLEAERGSSSKPVKGMSALIALADRIRDGWSIAITPDGPRGPRHEVQPGIIKLAQLTGSEIMPVHVEYSRVWKFRTWDQFQVPVPFSKVRVVFDTPLTVPRRMTEAEFEERRSALEKVLQEHAKDA